ncbi:MAG TPA: N-acetylmuramoyl-L-alanine amidase, partial [Kineosporiaceae bacterium]|nr:N-acetylmuramoyl-L-alanine amidase [Kineosporiaceae bacterium]
MRRLTLLLLTTTLAVPVTTLLPTVSPGGARPVPVPAAVHTLPLTGVDARSARTGDNGSVAAAGVRESQPASIPGAGEAVGPGAAVRPTPGTLPPPGVRAAAATLIVLTPQLSASSFSTLGVTWDLPAAPAPRPNPVVVVRTHSGSGWSDWSPLDTEAGGLTDPSAQGVQRAGTEPTWVGPSDGVQVRVERGNGPPPTGLRAELIDPGSSAYDGQVGSAPPASAAAVAQQPVVYSRASWGADESRVRSGPTLMPEIAAAVIHHTTDSTSYSSSQVPGMIRADYAYHLRLGWSDLGYNFLVDRFGRIWEGRRGGITAAVQGAHAGGFNYRTFGVAVIGNYERSTPSWPALGALQRLLAWKLDLAHDDPLGTTVLVAGEYSGARWPAGTSVRVPVIMGHRDVDYTACPGAKLYPWLARIRSGVASLMQAGLFNPSASAASGAYGTAGPTITARTLTTQSWTLSVADCTGPVFATRTGSVSGRGAVSAKWDGRRGAGWANPGVYDLRLDSRSGSGSARPVTASYVVTAPPPGPAPTGNPVQGSGGIVPVTPVRLLDSRTGPALATGPGGRVDVAVTGRGGIPADGTAAVALSVTALCPSAATTLT